MDKLEISFSQFCGVQWVFPEDKSRSVQGPCKQKCGLSFMDWDVVGFPLGKETLPRTFSQHDHLCKGQENLIWKPVLLVHS